MDLLFWGNLSINNVTKKSKHPNDFFYHLCLEAHLEMEFQLQQIALLYSCTPIAPRRSMGHQHSALPPLFAILGFPFMSFQG